MVEFHRIWIEQCAAARGIGEEFGAEKAMGYLIGEKLLNFVRAADTHPEFAAELPKFVAAVKRMFEPDQIREYLENIRRVGPFGHIGSDEEVEFMRTAGMVDPDPLSGAEDAILAERIKELLLP
ncbi:MAG: hypothetical protein HYR85_15670 [Planctomycetes bacterium]|nr:hypothetical protein [Planctomycetota bacterium]MBI3848130.1 hypothetical protein [Planctomycetota bacterium]